MFADANQVRGYVSKALFDGESFPEMHIYQIIYEMVQKLPLFENPNTIDKVKDIVATGRSIVYMHAGWWPSSDDVSFKKFAASDQHKYNNSLKCVLLQWDDLARNMPRAWQSGYVPNCCIFEDGELIKVFAGNGYVAAIGSNLAFTPQSEVKGFGEDLDDDLIHQRMAHLFKRESVSSIAQSPLFEEMKLNWEANGEEEENYGGIVLTPEPIVDLA